MYLQEEAGKENGRGKVLRMVYCATFVMHEGDTVLKMVGGKDLPWWRVEVCCVSSPLLLYRTLTMIGRVTLCMLLIRTRSFITTCLSSSNDVQDSWTDVACREPAEAAKHTAALQTHSYSTIVMPAKFEPWRTVPSTYM